jgi:hypothetical protein
MNQSSPTLLLTVRPETISAKDKQAGVLNWLGKAPAHPYTTLQLSASRSTTAPAPTSVDEQSCSSSVYNSSDSSDEEGTDSHVSSFYQFSLITILLTTLLA